jgi:3D (Asp-Asp-Asp) domain-containing protein
MKNILLILTLLPKMMGNSEFSTEVKYVEPVVTHTEVVTLTTYSPSSGETDSSPNITASGFKIDVKNPKKHKIIAVSRDLKRKWKFNQKVRIRKAGKYNGVYTIKDVMNKRHKKRIDILVGPKEKPIKLRGVEVTLLK